MTPLAFDELIKALVIQRFKEWFEKYQMALCSCYRQEYGTNNAALLKAAEEITE